MEGTYNIVKNRASMRASSEICDVENKEIMNSGETILPELLLVNYNKQINKGKQRSIEIRYRIFLK